MARKVSHDRLEDFHDCRQEYGNFGEDEFAAVSEKPYVRFCLRCKNYFYMPEKGGQIKSIESKDLAAIMDFVKNLENPPPADSLQSYEQRRKHKCYRGEQLYQHV
jgi:hypothetical protein